MHYTLLENGLDFIHCALIDLNKASKTGATEQEKKRLIKYSSLHLSSGIELILKNRLLEEHWTYVFNDMNRAKKSSFDEGDFSSLGFSKLFERLENLCNLLINDNNKKRITKLRNQRNRLEHFESEIKIQHFTHLINDNTKIIIDFLRHHASIETDEEQFLLDAIQSELRKSNEFYDEALILATTAAHAENGTGYSFLTCPECDEKLLSYGDGGNNHCYFCKYDDIPENAADLYVSNVLGLNSYSVIKDGGEWPVRECPECGCEALFHDGDNSVICFNCNDITSLDSYSTCSSCGILYYCSEPVCGVDICTACIDCKVSRN
jgi:hypothetical protein